MRLFIILLLTGIDLTSTAQQKLFIKITSAENKTPVAANILIKGTKGGYSADSTGIAPVSFSAGGNYTVVISAVGYEQKEVKLTIPHTSDTLEIDLESSDYQLEEVIVQ